MLWNQILLEEFERLACLTEEEKEILRTRAEGWSRVRQAIDLNMSLSKVDRVIKSLKTKYDDAQKYSSILPKRKQ